jgi:drug/metabolite transporter (DMT)-like permease
MIQRIQTIWLLLASACAFLSLKLSFYTGIKVTETGEAYTVLTGLNNLLLTILTVAVGIAALIMIFFYKDRKRQLWLTVATTVLSIVNIVLYFKEIAHYKPGGDFTLTAVVTFVVPFFLILAIRGIYRDNKLVKSVDRLR